MKVIIFNIENRKYYNGIESDGIDTLDKFYQEKKSNNPDIYNFQDYNGFCYGYASLSTGVVNLSELAFSGNASLFSDNSLVIFVSQSENTNSNEFFIVGWYKKAFVYNFLQRQVSYPSVGRDLYYNMTALAENCFLVPFENRNSSFDIDFDEDKNFKVIDVINPLYGDLFRYIENYDGEFSNVVLTDEKLAETLENPPENPISLFKKGYILLYKEENFLEAIKYFNTALLFKDKLDEKAEADVHYFKAMAFQSLHRFSNFREEFEIVLKYAKYDLTILKILVYLNMISEDFDKAVECCDKIIEVEKNDESAKIFLEELKCVKSECLIKLNKQREAISLLKEIIDSTEIEPIKKQCRDVLNMLMMNINRGI